MRSLAVMLLSICMLHAFAMTDVETRRVRSGRKNLAELKASLKTFRIGKRVVGPLFGAERPRKRT